MASAAVLRKPTALRGFFALAMLAAENPAHMHAPNRPPRRATRKLPHVADGTTNERIMRSAEKLRIGELAGAAEDVAADGASEDVAAEVMAVAIEAAVEVAALGDALRGAVEGAARVAAGSYFRLVNWPIPFAGFARLRADVRGGGGSAATLACAALLPTPRRWRAANLFAFAKSGLAEAAQDEPMSYDGSFPSLMHT
jgi:hypothetical protein